MPVRLQDSPAYLNFPSDAGHTVYGERIFVGYRWYDARDMPVTFPFGHGLSYTRFDYSGLEVTDTGDGLSVRLAVTNIGTRTGREVVQVYAGLPGSRCRQAGPMVGRLHFGLTLAPGEQRAVEIPVGRTRSRVLEHRCRALGGRIRRVSGVGRRVEPRPAVEMRR